MLIILSAHQGTIVILLGLCQVKELAWLVLSVGVMNIIILTAYMLHVCKPRYISFKNYAAPTIYPTATGRAESENQKGETVQ